MTATPETGEGLTDLELSAQRVRAFMEAYESWHYDEIGQSDPFEVAS